MLSALAQTLADLLFPPRCAACGARGAWLCPRCASALPRPRPPLCQRCGLPLAGAWCIACARPEWVLDALRVAADFAAPLRAMVHRLKYRGARHLAKPLGALLAEAYRTLDAGDAPVVPVPLHAERERARGFNQAELLARALAAQVDRPCAALLVRVRATPPQVGLSAEERWRNVAGAFAATTLLDGARLVLVDDVATTGATLNAAAAALRAAGARWVGGIALARPTLGAGPPGA